ncbi:MULTISPECIES: DUF4190 domain-containing protein [unclassified Salinibacterium]|uniref:DUF4190 domain-containing protein n=1 Tax=unclassified Salinibacterium TaxID=2632331 RepID=UPI00141DC75E|nr:MULTISPECIES: DUF4190 domain-containing protein [unclassified Salinibacterium]
MTDPTSGQPAASAPQSPPNPYLVERGWASETAVAPAAPVAPPAPGAAAPAPPHYQPYPTVAPAGAVPYTVQGQAYAYAAPRTNTLALVSMILSLASIVFLLPALAGVVCGHIALSQIKRTGEAGRGMALTGIIVGYIITGFVILMIAFPVLMALAFMSVGG